MANPMSSRMGPRLFQGQAPEEPEIPTAQPIPPVVPAPAPAQEPAPQEPAALQPLPRQAGAGPVRLTGPGAVGYQAETLESRRGRKRGSVWAGTTRAFIADTLPAMLPDPLDQQIVQDAIAYRSGPPEEWAAFQEKLGQLPDEVLGPIAAALDAYEKRLDAAYENPLAVHQLGREQILAIYSYADDPAKMQVFRDMTELVGDEESYSMAAGIERAINQSTVANVFGFGPSGEAAVGEAEGQVGFMLSGVSAAIHWGEQLEKAAKTSSWGDYMEDRQPLQEEARSERYENFAFQFSKRLARVTSERGIPYEAVPEMPVNVAEAREVFEAAMEAVELVQGGDISRQVTELALRQEVEFKQALKGFASSLWAYAEANPDAEVGELLDVISGIASGEITQVSQVEGNVPLVLTVLNLIGSPDRALASFTTEAVPKVRATELVFDDGYVAYDVIDATNHAIALMESGGVWEVNPEQGLASESQRGGELVDVALGAGEFAPDVLGALPGLASWSAAWMFQDDDATREPGKVYAKPVGVFEPVSDWVPHAERWENFKDAWGGDGAGGYIFDSAYDQATSMAYGTWSTKLAAGLMALGLDVVASPWNVAHSGVAGSSRIADAEADALRVAKEVTPAGVRREAAQAQNGMREVIFGFAEEPKLVRPKPAAGGAAAPGLKPLGEVIPTDPTRAKGTRKVRYADGREMSEGAAGMFDIIAKMFGRGGDFNAGGAEEIAELVMTAFRDTTESTVEGLMRALEQHPKFLDKLAAGISNSGAGDGWRKYLAAGLGQDAAKRRWAQEIWEQSRGEVQGVLEAGRITFAKGQEVGGKHWVKALENTRGVYLGDFGIPVSRIGRHVEAVDKRWRSYLKSDISNPFWSGVQKWAARPVGRVEAGIRNGVGRVVSGFGQSHWTTPLAAGERHVLPEVTVIPWRMRKLYAEKYRRVIASSSQRAQVATADAFRVKDGKGYTLLSEPDRKLVSLAVESGDSSYQRAKVMWENRELLKGHGITLPKTREALEKKLDGLGEYVDRVRVAHDDFAASMTELGILDEADLVGDYILHFYHAAEQSNVVRYLDDLKDKAAKEKYASKKSPDSFKRGTSAKVRQGPVDLYEAMRLGFEPELDAASLLYYRTMQFMEVDTRAQFLERLAADFGEPVVRGKEALAHVLRDMNTNRWVGDRRVFDAVGEVNHYYQGLARVRAALSHSYYRESRTGLKRLAGAIGIPMHELAGSPERMIAAMLRSDEFWKLASSKSKNVLDKVLPKSLRIELRAHGREVRSLRTAQRDLREYLVRRGTEPGILARLSDDDLGVAIMLQSQKSQFGESFAAIRKRLAGATRAKNYIANELKRVDAEVAGAKAHIDNLGAQRAEITVAWDAAKDALAARGYKADALSSSSELRHVPRVTEPLDVVPTPRESDQAIFQRYKSQQSKYRANYTNTQRAKQTLVQWENEAKRTAARLREAEKVMAQNAKALRKRGRDFAGHKQGMRAHGKELLGGRTRLDRSAEAFLEASRRLREAEARIATLMDGPAMRESLRYVRQMARRTAKMHRGIQQRVGRFAFENGVTASTARHRALAPRTVKGIAGAQARRARTEADAIKRLKGKAKRKAPAPLHVPAGEAHRYEAVEDFFQSFGWSSQEQATLLWETFGAHHLAEVPIKELEALAGPGGMYAKMGRFLFDPTDIPGKEAVLSIPVKGLDNAWDVATTLGLKPKGMSLERLSQALHKKLDELFAGAQAGDEAALELLGKVDPKKLSKIFVPEDVSGAFLWAKKHEQGSAGKVARIAGASSGASGFQRKLANTYIPLEIGLVYRQMVREGVTGLKEAESYIAATRVMGRVANTLGRIEWVNTMFKSGALLGRPNFKFVRRNSWFDGGKAIMHLGLWAAFNPKVVRQFYKDMRRTSGMLDTAAGPVSMAQFQQVWHTQGVTIFAAKMDSLNDFGRGLSARQEGRMRKGFESQLQSVGKEAARTKGAAVSKEGASGAILGGVLGEIAGGLGYEGASAGFTAGVVYQTTAKGGVTHTSGRLPTLAEWFVGHGAAANEALENFFRGFAYYTYVKAGQSPLEAVNRANTMLRDYSNLKPFTQEILSRTPFLFWNFTQQNAIAMTERFLDAPHRVAAMPRLMAAVSDGIGEEYRDEWQTLASSVFMGDKAFYMSDELEAAAGLLEPVYQLLSNKDVGASGEAVARNFSPFLRAVIEQEDGKLPPSIARKIFEEHGAVEMPGVRIYQNAQGAVVSKTNWMFNAAVVLTGMQIAVNDAGRIGGHAEKGDWSYSVLEFLGFGNYYDQESFYEGRRELMSALQRKMYDSLQEIKVTDAHGTPMPWTVNLSAEEKRIIQELLETQGGDYVLGKLEELDRAMKLALGEGTEPGTSSVLQVSSGEATND